MKEQRKTTITYYLSLFSVIGRYYLFLIFKIDNYYNCLVNYVCCTCKFFTQTHAQTKAKKCPGFFPHNITLIFHYISGFMKYLFEDRIVFVLFGETNITY